MKPDRLSELLQDIDKSLIMRAQKRRNNNKAIIIRMVAFAACLAIVVTGGIHAFVINGNLNTPDDEIDSIIGNEGIEFDPNGSNAGSIEGDAEGGTASDGAPSDPNSVVAGGQDTPNVNSGAVKKLGVAVYPKIKEIENTSLYGNDGYVKKLIGELMTDDGKNKVISPANIYFALAALAECTDGNTRTQILDLLGKDDVTSIRQNSYILWQKFYYNFDNSEDRSILTNSLWLSDKYLNSYNQDTIDILKDKYFASTFSGDFLNTDYTKAMDEWISEQTGGLLKRVSRPTVDGPKTMSLISTIYYKAPWYQPFYEKNTKPGKFYSNDGELEVSFMNTRESGEFYYSDKFSAVEKTLMRGTRMTFILPDESYTVNDILNDEKALEFMIKRNGVESKRVMINMSIPKFDITFDTDLIAPLNKLGITDVFNENADFSALTNRDIRVDEATHAARIKIDETGVEAAAYTDYGTNDGMPPEDEADFILNRPFIFVVSGEDNIPRFVGIVNKP